MMIEFKQAGNKGSVFVNPAHVSHLSEINGSTAMYMADAKGTMHHLLQMPSQVAQILNEAEEGMGHEGP